jgi:opacity protein-like surface antigen
MTICRSTLLGLAFVLGAAVSAGAADLGGYGGSLKDDSYDVGPSARVYLRGDIGYAVSQDPSMTENGVDLEDESMDNSWTFGGGLGLYLSPNWRTDVTADYRRDADLHGFLPDANPFIAGDRNFSLNNTVLLANLYYDFGSRMDLNPYVGAGIGWAFNHTHNGEATDQCGCVSSIEDGDQTSFAWALMAGVTKSLHDGLNLDAGYRFLSMGEAHTGNIVTTKGVAIDNTDPEIDHLYAHEFRVGLRYDVY